MTRVGVYLVESVTGSQVLVLDGESEARRVWVEVGVENLHLSKHLLDGTIELDFVTAEGASILDNLNRVRKTIGGGGGGGDSQGDKTNEADDDVEKLHDCGCSRKRRNLFGCNSLQN